MNTPTPSFKFFPKLNSEADLSWASSRSCITESLAARFFDTDSLQDKLIRAIAADQVLPIKEVLECFEFVARIRKVVRSKVIADLCCGHGLAGILLGIFEPCVDQVLLVDKQQPDSFDPLYACLEAVAPWIKGKVEYQRMKLANVSLTAETSVISAHACGVLTDTCIDLAIDQGLRVGVLPCCYPKRLCPAPKAILSAYGEAEAFDIDRTYRLEIAGYSVKWTVIPRCITPMNRVILAHRP